MARSAALWSCAAGHWSGTAGAPALTSTPSVTPANPTVAASRVPLEHVVSQVVRRVAWSGDGRSGSARVELGAGALAGATIVVHVDGAGEVRVAMNVPPGVDVAAWRDRLSRRLDSRGLQVAALDVE